MAYVYDNKTYRNLQQQVKENMDNIAELQEMKLVGLDVAHIVNTEADLSSVSATQGMMVAVGTAQPYKLFVYNESSWVDFGEFPKAGPQGEQGPQGEPGRQGPRGLTGPQGPRGYTGATGAQGPQGPSGERGPKGDKGDTGPKGQDGTVSFDQLTPEQIAMLKGPKGDTGAQGPQGPQGIQGQAGQDGEQGPRGIQGPKGDKGDVGPQGIQGPQGEKGDTGPEGPQGPIGPQGPKGEKGDTGPQGPIGPQGPKGDPGTGSETSIEVNGQTYNADATGKITLPDYPEIVLPENIVNSVNGKEGIVTLYAKDITAENTNTIQANLDRLDSDISRVEASIPDTSVFITSTELNAAIQTKQDILVNSKDTVVEGNKVTTVYGGGYTEVEKRLYHNCPKLETYNTKYNNYTGTNTSDITWMNEHLELNSEYPMILRLFTDESNFVDYEGTWTASANYKSDGTMNIPALGISGVRMYTNQKSMFAYLTKEQTNNAVAVQISISAETYTEQVVNPIDPKWMPETGLVKSINGLEGYVYLTANEIADSHGDSIQSNLERIDAEISRVEGEIPSIEGLATEIYVNDRIASAKDYTDQMISTTTSNMMTTDTAQDIICPQSARKTFKHSADSNDGFELYTLSNALILQNTGNDDQIEIFSSGNNCSISVRDTTGYRVTVGNEDTLDRGLSIIDTTDINNIKKTIYAASYIRQNDYTYNLPTVSGTLALTSDIPTTTSTLTNDSGFITNSALTGYATEDWVNQKGYLTSVSWGDIADKPTLVTTDTDQTITGKKVFGTLQAASLTDGTTTKTMTEVLAVGGGSTLYMHLLKLSNNTVRSTEAWTIIYNKSETPFDKDTLISWMTAKGLTNLPASGSGKKYSGQTIVRSIKYGTVSSTAGLLNFESVDTNSENLSYDVVTSVEDTVVAVD